MIVIVFERYSRIVATRSCQKVDNPRLAPALRFSREFLRSLGYPGIWRATLLLMLRIFNEDGRGPHKVVRVRLGLGI